MPVGYFIAQFFKKTQENIKRFGELQLPLGKSLGKSLILSYNDDPKYQDIYGVVYFLKLDDKETRIYGKINGLPPGVHGFHIHEFNDMSKGCESLGGHYNPFNKNHGSRVKIDEYGNKIINEDRHVGDLGNITVDKNGTAIIDIVDTLVKLDGPYSVLNRSLIIHEGVDDLGKAGTKESLTTGSAGKRIACGKIEKI